MLEIEHLGAAPAGSLGGKVHDLPNQQLRLPGHRLVGGGKLHMVALPWVGDAAPCQEGPPEEGHLAAFLLHNRIIHMQRQGIPLGKAEGLHDG